MFFIIKIDDGEVKSKYIVISKEKLSLFSKKSTSLLFKIKNRFFILNPKEWNLIVKKVSKNYNNKEKRKIKRVIASKTFNVKLTNRRRILIPKRLRKK